MKKVILAMLVGSYSSAYATEVCVINVYARFGNPQVSCSDVNRGEVYIAAAASMVLKEKLDQGFKIQGVTGSSSQGWVYTLVKR